MNRNSSTALTEFGAWYWYVWEAFELGTKYKLDVSIFERLISRGNELVTLRCKRRMRPEISRLISDIYPSLQDHYSIKGIKFSESTSISHQIGCNIDGLIASTKPLLLHRYRDKLSLDVHIRELLSKSIEFLISFARNCECSVIL